MTILLTKKNYDSCKSEIDACRRGEMCKIMRIDNHSGVNSWYEICADVTQGGWTTPTGREFHCVSIDENGRHTGLGTFYHIRDMMTDDGGCLLEFTDDLNPDLP